MSSNIQVFVRCRPVLKSELNIPVRVEVYPELHKILVRDIGIDKTAVKTFTYDKVFGSEATQAEIYSEIVAPLVEEIIQGFNCTIFAYGQTGTGKTFTIEGDRSPNLPEKSDDPLAGIIPRSMKHLFNKLSEQTLEHDIRVSFLELYNEEIFDLLSKNDELPKLKMYENSSQKGSVIVQGLEIITVNSMKEVYSILDKGCKKRRKAVTLLNKSSSRSHTIFTVTVSSKETSTTIQKIKCGKLNLVDLAGSENIGRSGAINKRAREAGNINQSLLALGRVITSLCEKAGHIPYRESKLTRLLQDSLGGQTKTAVIATISPSAMHIDETLNTLEYALRAKSITNKPELNAEVTVDSIVQDYLQKISNLRKLVYDAGKMNGVYVSEENIRNWQSVLLAKQEEKFKLLSQVENNSEEERSLDVSILELKRKLEEKENLLQTAKLKNERHKLQLKEAKHEQKLHEVMLYTLQPMYDCMHEKYHKSLAELKSLELDSSKRKELVAEVLHEHKKLQTGLNELHSKRKLWNDTFRQDSENLMSDMRNMNDSVKLLTTECKDYITVLKNGFDARKLDCENVFKDVSKAVNDLESINNDFQKNIDVCLLEEKHSKLKSIEDFEKQYVSSNDIDCLEPLTQIINHCESCLLSLSTAVNEWKTEATLKMEIIQKQIKDQKCNIKGSLESTSEHIKALLKKQKENMEEFNNIVSDSLNAKSVSKQVMLDKFQDVEQAISSLSAYCAEANEKEINKTNQVHSSLKNYIEIGSEITENLSNCGETFSKNMADMHAEAENHALGIFSEKWKNMKTEQDSAFLRYKNLTEELEKLSITNQNFCGIRDTVRRLLKDIDESNEKLEQSKSMQMVADSIMNRGNSFISRMVENNAKVQAALSEDKLNMEKFEESSLRLSQMSDSKISYYHQYLKNDLLKRFFQKDNEETVLQNEESLSETNTFMSDKTLCCINAASQETLSLEKFHTERDCKMCLKNTDDDVFKTDGNFSMIFCKDPLKDKAEEAGSSKSFTSPYFGSPIRRPRSRSSITARKNLQFPDAERLTQELLENVYEHEA